MLTLYMGNRLRAGRWLLMAMLGMLHGVMLLGVGSLWTPPLLLAHLGLFLLWQPLWRGENEVGRGPLVFIILAATVAIFWLSWWVLAFWLTGLFGLVGARVFAFRDRWTRLLYLSMVAYLLAVLLLWVVPHLFGTQPDAVEGHFEVGHLMMWQVLPVLLLTMAVLPVRNEPVESAQSVDFIYSLLLFMLLAMVVLGSLAFMMLARLDYLEALLRTLLTVGLVLLVFGVLWNTRFGFGGLQVMFSRYLLNVGTPFESWLTQLADVAQREPDAASYLAHATKLLNDLHWLSGLSWQSATAAGQLGQRSKHEVLVRENELRLTLYAKQELSPAVLLHIHLLVQLISYFYRAKQREETLRDLTRMQAVYETGSRLTHDLKNMLQSLLSLAALAQNREQRTQQLLQQQLPLLSQRIELILNKLQQPQVENEAALLPLRVWWNALQLRNRHHDVNWHAPDRHALDTLDKRVPGAMFDCVLDNLIENVLSKRQTQPGTGLSVEIRLDPLRLIVCDSGNPMPENITASLLHRIVVSENGLGIGLYQSARWAKQLGYHLTLSSNQQGKVCFELRE